MKIFYSYCHKDETHRDTLEIYLANLKKENLITEWHDRKILGGEEWDSQIQRHLESADIVILLITQNYLASTACNQELDYSMENKHLKTIVPIIVTYSTWKDSSFSNLQALPKDGKPIVTWQHCEEAWVDVYTGIKAIIKKKNEIEVKISFLKELEKTQVNSTTYDKIALSQIFVWPDLRSYTLGATQDDIEGSVSAFTNKSESYSIIKGIQLSGKSSIGKKLYIESRAQSLYPLFVDAEVIYKNTDFNSVGFEIFKNQYSGDYDEFKKLNNKIIIIDNYHHKLSSKILEWAKSLFRHVVILIDEEEFMLYFENDETFATYDLYNIRSFNRKKTHDLIIKWKTLDQTLTPNSELFDRTVDELEDKISNIIRNNQIVPSHPFYILSILLTFDALMPGDYQITAYGHCYNALITSQLVKKNISPADIGDCYNYLTYLAYHIYQICNLTGNKISRDNYKSFKDNYKNKFLIQDILISRIENNDHPIIRFNDEVRFEYGYIYYYFIGKYLAENISTDHITDLCANIYRKDAANILIFTIHHTTNTFLLDEIQLHCMLSFEKYLPAKLTTSETKFMDSLIGELPTKVLNNKSTKENRDLERKSYDEKNSGETEVEVDDDENRTILEVNKALKIIEVLGQILKNRAGSFAKNRIREIMIEVEDLGLRLLNYFINSLRSDEFFSWLEERLKAVEKERKDDHKSFNDDQRKEYIEKNIQIMGLINIFGMLNKIFRSVSSEKIYQIQTEISQSKNDPAYDFLNLLFEVSYSGIKIDSAKKLLKSYKEEKNIWALKTMSMILQRYLNTHNVDYKLRQQLCTLLGIDYIPNKPMLAF